MNKNILIGKFGRTIGLQAEISVWTYTEKDNQFFDYKPVYILNEDKQQNIELHSIKKTNRCFKAKVKNYLNTDAVSILVNKEIYTMETNLAKLNSNQFYWKDLYGLKVYNPKSDILLGKVNKIFYAGSYEVIEVMPCKGSLDQQARTIPFIMEKYILNVDLDQQIIQVDWEKDW